MTLTTPSMGAAPALVVSEQAAEQKAGSHLMRGVLIGLTLVVVLFVSTYAFAWFQASRLTATFMADADTSYAAGNYLNALTGYEEFDQEANAYVSYGGYMKALNIWTSAYAWPKPDSMELARTRIDEVLQEHLTVTEAESFIQVNIGRQNPYLGTIYLRLGELYEAEGDIASARVVYDEIAELFPGQDDLIARAEEHLARLGSE
jgi:tetratricopeptide (TPR) repeat protein